MSDRIDPRTFNPFEDEDEEVNRWMCLAFARDTRDAYARMELEPYYSSAVEVSRLLSAKPPDDEGFTKWAHDLFSDLRSEGKQVCRLAQEAMSVLRVRRLPEPDGTCAVVRRPGSHYCEVYRKDKKDGPWGEPVVEKMERSDLLGYCSGWNLFYVELQKDMDPVMTALPAAEEHLKMLVIY